MNNNQNPREKVIRPPRSKVESFKDTIAAAVDESNLSSVLMSINDWIEQTLAVKGYIQAQEDREDFIIATGAGATKFNKWMMKAGFAFNKQSGRWTRWEDR